MMENGAGGSARKKETQAPHADDSEIRMGQKPLLTIM
jgi:hypothetical protein